MKLCIDCKHFTPNNYCHAPENGISPLDGKPIVRFATHQRSHKCGPDGKFWVQRCVNNKKPWYKFWSKK